MIYEKQKKQARLAGYFYLALGVFGGFGIMNIPMNILVSGDAEASISNILSNEFVYRLSIVSYLISQVSFIFLVRALHRLLEEVNPQRAQLMVTLVLIAIPIAFINALNPVAALIFAKGANFLDVFNSQQLHAMSMVFLKLYEHGLLVVEVFWGLWLFPFGLLVLESKFIPRVFGILLIIGCFSYLIESCTGLLFPQHKELVSLILVLPLAVSEFSIIFWLLIKGVKRI